MSRPPPPPVLPEWLTAGVGGFVREHPAVVAFGALIGIAALMIAAAAWEGRAGSLAREKPAPEPLPVAAPMPIAAEQVVVTETGMASAPPNAPMNAASSEPAKVQDSRPASAIARATDPSPAQPASQPIALSTGARERVLPAPPQYDGARNVPTSERAPAAVPRAPPREEPTIVVAPAPERAALVVNAAPDVAIATRPVVAAREATAPYPQVASTTNPVAPARAPSTDEIEALFVTFVDSYDRGRLDAIAALFDDDAQSSERRGRAEIRRNYDELFRRSEWRRMKLTRVSWKHAGDVTHARAEAAVRTRWRDGREGEELIAMDIDLARRDGRVVIVRLAQQAGTP